MLKFTPTEWYEIRGQKVAHIKRLPDEFYEYYYSPDQLKDQHVLIDDKIYVVMAVERFMLGVSPKNPYRFSCGLMVREYVSPSPGYNSNSTLRDSSNVKSLPEKGEQRGRSPMLPELGDGSSSTFVFEPQDTDTSSTS